jgi:hypothetical protein
MMKILAETLAVLMVFLSTCALAILVMLLSTSAQAATVIPLKGQTSQTIQQDTSACQSQANAQHPVQSTVPSGGRVKGAATAAVAGATIALIGDDNGLKCLVVLAFPWSCRRLLLQIFRYMCSPGLREEPKKSPGPFMKGRGAKL